MFIINYLHRALTDRSILQRFVQMVLFDQSASRSVDQDSAALHFGKGARVEQMSRFWSQGARHLWETMT